MKRVRVDSGVVRVIVLGAAWLCAMAGSGCDRRAGGPPPAAAREPMDVQLAPVERRAVDRFVTVTGTLFGEVELDIAAEVEGRIVALSADLGDEIEHGAPIAQIDPTSYRLAVDEARAAFRSALARLGLDALPAGDIDVGLLPVVIRAEAQAANAASRLERARALYQRTPPLISEQDFADIVTQSEVARAEVQSERLGAMGLVAEARVRAAALARAEEDLARTRIVAPAEERLRYRVAVRNVSVGEVVTQGTPLFRLVSLDRVKGRAGVPERFAPVVRVGARVRLFVEQNPEPFEAEVARISPVVDVATRTFDIEIRAANADAALKPGSFFRADVLTAAAEEARFVPRSAVVQFAGVYRVFSVKDGKVVDHRVRPGEAAGEMIEVDGLPAQIAAVVATPQRGMAAGAPARVLGPSDGAATTAGEAAAPPSKPPAAGG